MLERFGQSLSLRLLAIFLVMGVLFAYGAMLGIRWVYVTDDMRELVSGHLQLHVDYVRRDIGDPPVIDNARAITETVPVDIRIAGPDIDWASDPDFPGLDELTFGNSDVFSDAAEGWLKNLDGVQFAATGSHGFLSIRQGPYSIVVSSPKISAEVPNRSLVPIIVGFGLLLVLLAYLAVRWLFKPLDAIRDGAAQIGDGNFGHRISALRNDELGKLASEINAMAQDVEGMLDAKRQLLYGISHELRSPLSRMKLELEMLPDEHPAIAGLAADIEEMEKVIATLLEAERLNSRHAAINVSRVSALDLIQSLVEDYFSRDRSRIDIRVDDSLYMNVDEVRVSLMIKNLLSNALRYSEPDDGPVVVEVSANDSDWIIRVSDRGPGIPADQARHVGEPFYRGDPSRTRRTGGSGLGLYLSTLVARAHGGTLRLAADTDRGATFIVQLPFEPV